ncbi:MAG TPA: ribonuclease HI family protein [Candidatus Pacearchaeota archaeon]|jgi:ribonuclease HI|nr:ribonuclease HI family protein [Candidatus Pacearchaeota archaeon]HRR94659.1 ribonuclease HI family protein [Candidatus Paceibacterota bacterium]HPC30516.1 ribonuclease HI family protein [Candidatus Pacearchaeota archaeon]HQG09141.1 ribonuclease HI family protein [Candidatus Pacearchaeota archaeon]HQH20108.1 ribonuclease HI family protein [Candidatus Pacearchaeota archaeon]
MKIIAYTDGGARGNPGPAALGAVIQNEKGQTIKKYSEFLGEFLTNNEAEYRAVIFVLKKIKALIGKDKAKQTEVEIRADSELMVKQMNGEYKLSEPRIQEFFIEIWNLKIDYKLVTFKHISREMNKEADALVNEALDREEKQNSPNLFD